jgi:hypothetical protein
MSGAVSDAMIAWYEGQFGHGFDTAAESLRMTCWAASSLRIAVSSICFETDFSAASTANRFTTAVAWSMTPLGGWREAQSSQVFGRDAAASKDVHGESWHSAELFKFLIATSPMVSGVTLMPVTWVKTWHKGCKPFDGSATRMQNVNVAATSETFMVAIKACALDEYSMRVGKDSGK